uniref:Uncharacterized protein n=1 Tax=Arion vulgaris TaxID=1028688 RepID=A0A0B7AMZ8_9EUPU
MLLLQAMSQPWLLCDVNHGCCVLGVNDVVSCESVLLLYMSHDCCVMGVIVVL